MTQIWHVSKGVVIGRIVDQCDKSLHVIYHDLSTADGFW